MSGIPIVGTKVSMDNRLKFDGDDVLLSLKNGYKKRFPRSLFSSPQVEKYLYPTQQGYTYHDNDPVFTIGTYHYAEKYYFSISDKTASIITVSKVGEEARDNRLVIDDGKQTVRIIYKDGFQHEYPLSDFRGELTNYLYPDRQGTTYRSDGTPIFHLGAIDYYFGKQHSDMGEQTAVFFYTELDPFGEQQVDDAEDPVEIQYAEYLPRKHPDVYKAFWKALKNLGGDLSYWEYITLMKKKAPKYGYVLSPVSADRVGLYKILLEYLYHTGVMATSSDLNYDLTRDQKMAYPTWDPYENKANFATTRRGYSKWIACRLACRPETLPVPNNPNIVKVQTDELGYAIVSNTNSAWIEKRDEWPMRGLRVRNRNEELFDWYNSRSFAYYVMGHVPYEKGDVSEFPVSPCGKPEFEEYKQRFEFMPVKEIDISIRKTWDWCQLYNYDVSDHEGVGLYPKINTLQVQGFMFSNFNCTVGYTLDEAINGLTAEAAIYREEADNRTAMVGWEHRQPPKRVFPLLQLDAEHTEIVDLMYEYNKRFYRLNMYERRVYMTKNTTAISRDPSDVRGDYWLYSRYDVEYQERSSAWFPQSKRVARDPVNTYPLAADDAVALSYDAIQQDKIRSKYVYVWVEVGVSVLAGVLTTLAVQYLGQDIQVSVISGGVVLFTGLLITLILNLGDIIRSVAGETVALGKESVGL